MKIARGLPMFSENHAYVDALILDNLSNDEIQSIKKDVESAIETQLFDGIFDNVKIEFLTPNVSALITPEQYSLLRQMEQDQYITSDSIKSLLGLHQPQKFTVSRGNDENPSVNTWKTAV